MKIHLLYAIPANETERWTETLLGTGSPERLAKIREAVHVDGVIPDFAKTLSR